MKEIQRLVELFSVANKVQNYFSLFLLLLFSLFLFIIIILFFLLFDTVTILFLCFGIILPSYNLEIISLISSLSSIIVLLAFQNLMLNFVIRELFVQYQE